MIRLPEFTYIAPHTVDSAARLLAEHGREAMLVAGGTDLFPNMKRRQMEPKVLVSIRGTRDLRGVRGSSDGWTIGEGTSGEFTIDADDERMHDSVDPTPRPEH